MSETMQAVWLRTGGFSTSNPASSSDLIFEANIPRPRTNKPDQVLVRVHAASITRDQLLWPETYQVSNPILGYDLAGTVVASPDIPGSDSEQHTHNTQFRAGDSVYGLVGFTGGSTWAEYAVVPSDRLALMPHQTNWAESAALILGGLTAWQALFIHGGIPEPDFNSTAMTDTTAKHASPHQQKILVTGGAGAVGIYVIQLATLAGLHVDAASSSQPRNGDFLRSLGATGILDYVDLDSMEGSYDLVIDTVGGEVLRRSWSLVKDKGTLISVDTSSYDFIHQHEQEMGNARHVKAKFFIVEPSGPQLTQLSRAVTLGQLKSFVAREFSLVNIETAYQAANTRRDGPGKVVLSI